MDNIPELSIRKIEEKSKIVVYGTGSHTQTLFVQFPWLKEKIMAIASNEKTEGTFLGFKVIDETELTNISFDTLLVSSKTFEKEIYRRLLKLGVNKSKILLIYNSKEKLDSGSDLSWKERIKKLREEEKLFEAPSLRPKEIPNPKNILIYSPVPWSQGCVERMISIALQLRGHNVDDYICGGGYPACGMEHEDIKRRSCEQCLKVALNWSDIWGLNQKISAIKSEHIDEANKFVDKMDLDNFKEIYYQGFPIGNRIYEQVFWYFGGNLSNEIKVKQYVRDCAISYIAGAIVAKEILESKEYEVLIMCNGKTIESAPMIDLAKKKNLRIMTWEESLIFDWDDPVVEFRQGDVWEKIKHIPLEEDERKKIKKHLHKWRYSEVTNVRLYKNPIEDLKKIKEKFDIRDDSYKVVLFPNTLNDTVVIGMDTVFSSMLEWIFEMVEYAIKNRDIDLIIRPHPAEAIKYVPQNKVFVKNEVLKQFGTLPENITIIDPGSDISSYSLLSIADVPMTYTGTLSLEGPIYGRKFLVCGKTHFLKKGFTTDPESKEQIFDILNRRERIKDSTDEEREIALRYAYFYFFRINIRPEFYNFHKKQFELKSFRQLAVGGDPFFENICDSIINYYAFVDLAKKDRIPIKLL